MYYKATRPDGRDFYSGTVDYAGALVSREPVEVRDQSVPPFRCCTSDVLHAADVPTATLIGGSWPCRLFEVDGEPVAQEGHKFGFRSLVVVREVESRLALGPQGQQIEELIERAGGLNPADLRCQHAAPSAAQEAARDAAQDATSLTGRTTSQYVAWWAMWNGPLAVAWARNPSVGIGAAWATGALIIRDQIGQHGFTQEHYDILTRSWREAVGPLHPDDAAVS